MGDGSKASMEKRPRARKRHFYEISPGFGGGGPGFWLEDESILPPYRVFRLPASTAPATFVFDRSQGSLPIDLAPYYGWWLISDRTKTVFEKIDPEAFVFVSCRIKVPHGSYHGPDYWLCDIARVLDALDETQSRLRIRIEDDSRSLSFGKKVYFALPGSKLVFIENAVGSAHIFRMAHNDATVICDQEMKDACKSAGLKRIRFDNALKL